MGTLLASVATATIFVLSLSFTTEIAIKSYLRDFKKKFGKDEKFASTKRSIDCTRRTLSNWNRAFPVLLEQENAFYS